MNRWVILKIIAIVTILLGMKMNHRPLTVIGVLLAAVGLFMSKKDLNKKF